MCVILCLRSATEKKRLYHTVYHAKIYVDRVGLRLFAGLTDSKRGYGMGRRMVGLHAVFLASALMLGGCGTGNKVVNFEIPNENVTTITFSEINMSRKT